MNTGKTLCIKRFFGTSENAVKSQTNLERRVGLCPRRHRQEAPESRRFALHLATDSVRHALRENALAASLHDSSIPRKSDRFSQSVVSLRFLTGQ